MPTLALRALLVATMLLMTLQRAQAQVPVPNADERAWLNAAIPGIVSPEGIMDTLHPGIATLIESELVLYDLNGDVQLPGMGYLSALTSLRIWTYDHNSTAPAQVSIPRLGMALQELHITLRNSIDVDLQLPLLPPSMERLALECGNVMGGLDIAGMPEHIGEFDLANFGSLAWSGPCAVEEFRMGYSWETPVDLQVPMLEAEEMVVHDMVIAALDLSLVSAPDLSISISLINGPLAWPSGLEFLNIQQGEVNMDLPAFPEGLTELELYLVFIECLPWLPSSLTTFTAVPPYVPCLPNWPVALVDYDLGPGITPATATYCTVLNSACPNPNPVLTGQVFLDLDGDGERDPGEHGVPGTSVWIAPSGQMVGTDTAGLWHIGVAPGEHTITVGTDFPYVISISPDQHTGSVPALGDLDAMNDFAVTVVPGIQDLRAHLYGNPARAGFNNRLYLVCRNVGTVTAAPEATFAFDPVQSWVSADPAPDGLSGNTATWSLPALGPGAEITLTVDLHTPASTSLGQALGHLLSVGPLALDAEDFDNIDALEQVVVGSYDPNDKLVSPQEADQFQVAEPLTYTIRFQNTGTAAAERVLLVDTLSAKLDHGSMGFVASSHFCTWSITDGVLMVEHPGIHLPDSASDEAGSQGFVSFTLRPDLDMLAVPEDTIINLAYIFFDFNAPIVTPPAVFTYATFGPVSEVDRPAFGIHPNPTSDRFFLTRAPPGDAPIDYRLFDPLGRPVLQGRQQAGSAIDVEGLPPGLYLLQLGSRGESALLRVVKR